MSKYHQSSNPFESDEEDDNDFVMVGKTKPNTSASKPGFNSSSSTSLPSSTRPPAAGNQYSYRENAVSSSSYSSSMYDSNSPFDDRREQLMMRIANSENTQLESTQRALASIYDSEAMGIATADELVRQSETINNIENKLDNMEQNMKVSQRHLNNIKSVFGGIKNWWSGDKKPTETKSSTQENANSRLRATIEKTEKAKPDTSGFYEDDDVDTKFMAKSRKPGSGQYTMIAPVTRSAREEEVDYNLALMSDGMSRLKGLAKGLGDEIERQNEQLDRVTVKAERTDGIITHQNSQMRNILKK